MLPVPGYSDVFYSWIEIKNLGFPLHGFLLYIASDHNFPEYVSGDGLGDMDYWTRDECAIFIVHSPSAKWIEYTRREKHTWWTLFGQRWSNDRELSSLLAEHGQSKLLTIDGQTASMQEVFAPALDEFQHRDEIGSILEKFGLGPTDHPCLIFFRDLGDNTAWRVRLRDLVGVSVQELRKALQTWFDGPEFGKLLKEAGNGIARTRRS
jgi:hypothetical protein